MAACAAVQWGHWETFLEGLIPWRDGVLGSAGVGEGDMLLDAGAGDGLISLGALDFVGEKGRVVFSDVSQDLLDHGHGPAEEMGTLDRRELLLAPAEDLSAVGDASVDAVTTGSLLTYVNDKRRTFEEFYRVLKVDDRVSLFEPINGFRQPQPPLLFLGYDPKPVQNLAEKPTNVYRRIQPVETDPMPDFDERDLLGLAEGAGFAGVRLDYEAEISTATSYHGVTDWKTFVKSTGNPNTPTIEEAMNEVLTPEETLRFTAHLRPLVENGRRKNASAPAFLRAVKGSPA